MAIPDSPLPITYYLLPIMDLANNKKATDSGFKFNLLDPQFYLDPYPTYHRLRSQDPVHWSLLKVWVLTRYADIKTVLGDRRRFVTDKKADYIEGKNRYVKDEEKNFNVLVAAVRKWLIFMDPPDHTSMRQTIDKTLLLKKIGEMTPYIQQVVEEAIASNRDRGRMDLITDLAAILPTRVISRILGLPVEYSEQVKEWANELFLVFEPLMSLSDYDRLNRVASEFREFLLEIFAQKLRHPQEDLISYAIAKLLDGGSQLSKEAEEKLLSIFMGIFSAGEETTVNLIGNGMLALLRDRESMERLKAEPTIIESAVEELLRYDPPVQIIGREATENLEIGGKTIRAGDSLLLCLGAANRDPDRFSEPDRLDLVRSDNAHLAFGDGIHHCLGSLLARVQGRIAIETIIRELPELQLDTDEPEWHKTIMLRGLKSLPVKFSN